MKKIKKISIVTVLAIAVVFGITKLMPAYAATNPNLGAASTFSVIAQTAITGTPTNISGNVGMNNVSSSITGVAGPVVDGIIYATDAVPVAPGEAVIDPAVQSNLSTAYGDIKLLPIEGTPIAVSELGGITRGPGVYDIPGNATLSGGVLTLDGAGTYIFRTDPSSNLTSSAGGSINFINGARACDLFWNIGTAAEIGGTSFAGTIIAHTGVHFTNSGVALNGRALAEGADVTLGVNGSISGPTCPAPVVSPTLNVIKHVSGGTASAGNWLLTVSSSDSGTGIGSAVGSTGTIYTLETGHQYSVAESGGPSGYTPSSSDECTIANAVAGTNYTCTITNTYIPPVVPQSSGGGGGIVYGCKDPTATNYNAFVSSKPELCKYTTVVAGESIVPPLIHVTKVPSPLSLLIGWGLVTYTETITNPGTVPLSNVTISDDKCSPVNYVSGDLNNDKKLDSTESWIYTCQVTLSGTTTNTASVSGYANGITAKDFAVATVVASIPGLPKTGYPPRGINIIWGIAIMAGITLIATSIVVLKKRKI